MVQTMLQGTAVEGILERYGDLESYPDETPVPYREFAASGQTYYFTAGGFLYRKDPGTEEVGDFSVAILATKSGTTGPLPSKDAPILTVLGRGLYRGSSPSV